MGIAKFVAQGFLAMASLVCLFTFVWLPQYVDLWVALGVTLFLAVPLLARSMLLLKNHLEKKILPSGLQIKKILLFLQGVALACWGFDVVTTYFSLKIPGAFELNPLGWPLGILGAAIYYVPVMLGTYYLLYRVNTKLSLYAAMVMTAITLLLASMNLNAGMGNFGNMRLFGNLGSDMGVMGFWLVAGTLLAISNVKALAARPPPFC